MYAIIDTETTGGSPKKDKLTEIAVIVHDGKEIIREFSTLINPECKIPYYITQITGITNEMVAGAPKFYEIARELIELTENKVFVAHNVHFDYNFIRNEYSRLGYDYKRDRLCTVRLSQKLIPGLKSYSLGKLCKELHIPVNGRHRASGDATATTKLFEMLIHLNASNEVDYFHNAFKMPRNLNPALDTSLLDRLPESSGVYFFYNADSEIIYIGKSKNIRTRVLSHFSNHSSKRAVEMYSRIADIAYEPSGSELVALLKESYAIKKYKPYYNRAQKRTSLQFGIYYNSDPNEYINFIIDKTAHRQSGLLACFSTKEKARQYLNSMIDKYELCQKLCGMYSSSHSCFHFKIGACRGACLGREKPDEYNARARKVINDLCFEYKNLVIIDSGRNPDERSAIKIEHGKFIGYGYFNVQYASENHEVIAECIKPYPDNREIRNIIRQYLRNNAVEKILVY